MTNDWQKYAHNPPPDGVLCVFRLGHKVWTATNDFHPQANIANLEWKLTGIALETQVHDAPEVSA